MSNLLEEKACKAAREQTKKKLKGMREVIINSVKKNNKQPDPKEGKIDIYPLVMKDILQRVEDGEKKYGIKLQSHNGRDTLQDAYEEALDLVMYLKQRLVEENG